MNKHIKKILSLKEKRLKIKQDKTKDRKKELKDILDLIIDRVARMVVEGDAIIFMWHKKKDKRKKNIENTIPNRKQIIDFICSEKPKSTNILFSVITRHRNKYGNKIMFHLPRYIYAKLIPALNMQKKLYTAKCIKIKHFI